MKKNLDPLLSFIQNCVLSIVYYFFETKTKEGGVEKWSTMDIRPRFNDGQRVIDMVLAYSKDDYETENVKFREEFQKNLVMEGLELEEDEVSDEEEIGFIKIHIPEPVMKKFAHLNGVKKPAAVVGKADLKELLHKSRKTETELKARKRQPFYSDAQRSNAAWQLMMAANYTDGKRGIERLLQNNVFLAAYPLHDGPYKKEESVQELCQRQKLYNDWVKPHNWYKQQPLNDVRNYFGIKVGLYFAWLGLYTKMLIPASIVGCIAFLYGLVAVITNSEDTSPSQEICDEKGAGNLTMCPECDVVCGYSLLSNSCTFSRVTYICDTSAAVAFSVFMAFWACLFLELWRRRRSELTWLWDLSETDESIDVRPEYEHSVKTKRYNVITGKEEPYLTTLNKTVRVLTSISAVMFMVVVVLIATLAIIVYRLSALTAIYAAGGYTKKHSHMITSITASLINLVVIIILTKIYHMLSKRLTNWENPRTQREYEKSLIFKMVIFQSVNFYTSLIYIAFFKGRFYTHPGDKEAWESILKRITADVCGPPGCMSELLIQLAIVMVGKQLYTSVLEICVPWLKNWWRKRSSDISISEEQLPWKEEYLLTPFDSLSLHDEYLEMIAQFGFVTLFVAAFPLAPLFALLNNIAEIRLDAYKLTRQTRRPIALRVKDIEPWFRILLAISKIAIAMNAFVIAFTSDFIPRLVYKYIYSPDGSLKGYIEFSLSEFNTSDYGDDMGPDLHPGEYSPEICYYPGYRYGPGDPNKYRHSSEYWYIFAARMAFIVIFDHLIYILTGILAYAIPDVSPIVRQLMEREKHLAREKILRKYR